MQLSAPAKHKMRMPTNTTHTNDANEYIIPQDNNTSNESLLPSPDEALIKKHLRRSGLILVTTCWRIFNIENDSIDDMDYNEVFQDKTDAQDDNYDIYPSDSN